jgi:thioredoxin-related protein
MATLIRILALVLGSITLTVYAANYAIDFPENWAQVSQLSRDTQIPIMVIFTADDCGYCRKLKQEVVLPMLARGDFKGKALVREFDIDVGGKITDFDGERIRRRIFVNRYDVFATPTVVFVDDRGEGLLDPLVGFNQADAYVPRLNETLDSAKTAFNVLRDPNLALVAERRIQP